MSGGGPSASCFDDLIDASKCHPFDNAIPIVSTRQNREVAHVRMFNPEPASITGGRRLLYDARATSSHGDSACASCHIFGDFDSLAWDLGDPDNTLLAMPRDYDPTNPFTPESQAREAVTFSVSAAVIQSLGGPAPIFCP